MAVKGWGRDELLVALNLYCRFTFGQLHARNPEIITVAARLGRTANALAMKCCNFASLDPVIQESGRKGLSKTSKLDREVWDEFCADPESVSYKSELQFAAMANKPIRVAETVEWEDVRGLDKEAVSKVRVNQHFFRAMVLAGYNDACAVCGLPVSTLLVASHIVPWSVDAAQRMNPRNGMCLCSLHDRAFDRGILRIERDYTIRFPKAVAALKDSEPVNLTLLRFEGSKITLPDRWHPDPELLERHIALHA